MSCECKNCPHAPCSPHVFNGVFGAIGLCVCNAPYVNPETNTWWEYDPRSRAFVDTQVTANGASAYEIAVKYGYEGTEEEFAALLTSIANKKIEWVTFESTYEEVASAIEADLLPVFRNDGKEGLIYAYLDLSNSSEERIVFCRFVVFDGNAFRESYEINNKGWTSYGEAVKSAFFAEYNVTSFEEIEGAVFGDQPVILKRYQPDESPGHTRTGYYEYAALEKFTPAEEAIFTNRRTQYRLYWVEAPAPKEPSRGEEPTRSGAWHWEMTPITYDYLPSNFGSEYEGCVLMVNGHGDVDPVAVDTWNGGEY